MLMKMLTNRARGHETSEPPQRRRDSEVSVLASFKVQ